MKIIPLVAVFIIATLTLPLSGQSQTFTSQLQRDITPSGIDKLSSHDVTIIFSKENMQVTIIYKDLDPDTYNLRYFRSNSSEDQNRTMYTIDDNPFFQALLLFEYKSVHKIKFADTVYSYEYNFSFVETNKDGSTNHSTSFFCKKVKQ